MSPEVKFRDLLNIRQEVPSLNYLRRIVSAHLRLVPWENISKLLQKKSAHLALPSFSQYVLDIEQYGFGGTCHAKNTFLSELLNYLGFNSSLVSAVPDGLPRHVSIRVTLEAQEYFVDVGLMTSFAGPFLLDHNRPINMTIGDQIFDFKPSSDFKNWSLQISRQNKVIRSYLSNPNPLNVSDHITAVKESFNDSDMFIKNLVVHRCEQDHEVGLWNNKIYKVRGTSVEARTISSLRDLNDTFDYELKLPNFPLKEVIDQLNAQGTDIFTKSP